MAQTWLGNGAGWEASPSANWAIPRAAIADADGDPGYRLVDMNGDGLLDVFYVRAKADGSIEKGLYLNDGSKWASPVDSSLVPSIPFVNKDGVDEGVRLLSVTGKGVTDVVRSFEGDKPIVFLNNSRRVNLLQKITDGLGLTTRLWYQTLLEIDNSDPNYPIPESRLSDRVYERGPPDAFPLIAPIPTMYVVRRATIDEGNGREVALSYRYGAYRIDSAALRPLGFRWRESLNETNGIVTHLELLQDPRFRSSTRRETTCALQLAAFPSPPNLLRNLDLCPEGSAVPYPWSTKLTETWNCWQAQEAIPGGPTRKIEDCWDKPTVAVDYATSRSPPKIRQINLAKSRSRVYELDGKMISESTDSFEYEQTADLLDQHANVARTRSELADGSYIETVNSYADDISKWYLGRLIKTTVTKVGDTISADSAVRKYETRETAFSYDMTTGLLNSQIVNANTDRPVTTTSERDGRGNIVVSTVSAPGETTRTTRTTYDNDGRFVIASENALRQVSKRANSATTGKPLSVVDPNSLVTTIEYDGFGRLVRQINPDGVVATTKLLWSDAIAQIPAGASFIGGRSVAFGAVTQVDTLPPALELFDSKNRSIRAVTDGFTRDTTAHRYIFKDTEYDVLGRLTRTSLPYEPGHRIFWRSNNTFDVMNRVLETTSADGLVTQTVYSSATSGADARFANCTSSASKGDIGGAIVAVTVDPSGKKQRTTYARTNMRKQLVYAVDAMHGCVSNEYDAGGRIEVIRGTMGAVTKHVYDARGDRVRTSDPDLGTWTYAYDAFGKVVRQVDAKGQIASIEYDLIGRPRHRTLNDSTTTWEYDTASNGVGKVAFVSNSNGFREAMLYDRLGRPERKITQIRDEQFVSTVSYDHLSRPRALYYPTGFSVTNNYDGKGFLISVVDGRDQAPYWTAKDIDIYGRVVNELLGNGVSTTREFDETNGRTKSIAAKYGSRRVLDLRLEYDKIGNLLSRKEDVESKNEAFRYDVLDRLREAQESFGATSTFDFDEAGRLTFKSGVGKYSYRKAGSSLDSDTKSEYFEPLHGVLATRYGGSERDYRYDRNGNMIASSDAAFEYTSDNKVQLLYGNHDKWSRFEYGPSGERFRQLERSGTATVETTYVGSYERVDESGLSYGKVGRYVRNRHYVNVGRALIAVVETDAEYVSLFRNPVWETGSSKPGGEIHHEEAWYVHTDQLGSVLRVTNGIGDLREKLWYDSWGARRTTEVNRDNEGDDLKRTWKRGFAGHEHLDAFSMVHMNGRVFNTSLSQFTSVDALNEIPSDTQSGNGYMYARGNPLKFIDPSGQGLFDDIVHGVGDFLGGVANGIGQIGRGIGDALSAAGKWLAENWRTVVIVAVAITITVFTAGAAGPIIAGMLAGAASGALGAALYGGSIDDILAGAIKGGVIGAISAGVLDEVGGYYAAQPATTTTELEAVAAHGVIGGAREAAEGGDFWRGFISGAATKATSSLDQLDFNSTAANAARAAVVGGTVGAVSGGKFANGAMIGAFSYLYNDALHFNGRKLQLRSDDGKIKCECDATSGRPGVTDPKISGQGPIPEGEYTMDPKNISEVHGVRWFMRNITGDWGSYRVPLDPSPSNEMYGRSGVYIHGGTVPGSAGCIDVGACESKIFPILQKEQSPVKLKVEYGK